jgi:ketosteroid isomerase-like protein
MIDQVVQRWSKFLFEESAEELDTLLAEDVVFHPPLVDTPLRGKDVNTLFFQAGKQVMVAGSNGTFRYTRQVTSGDVAMLEFETTLGTTHFNGIDVIRCDSAGRIVEFRMMIRPLEALNVMLLGIAATARPGSDLAAVQAAAAQVVELATRTYKELTTLQATGE